MPYANKEKNNACKKEYAQKHASEIYQKRKAKEELWSPEKKAEKKARLSKEYKENKNSRQEQTRRCLVKRRYGISLEELNNRREAQRKSGDLCGLCKQPLGEDAHFDHDHNNGQLRDFLHKRCNLAIGLLRDDPEVCRLAAEYLERHKRDGRRTGFNGNERTNTNAEGAA